jgi:hypothetical protein
MMPGSSIGSFRSWMLAACFIMFSRVRSLPHAVSVAAQCGTDENRQTMLKTLRQPQDKEQ